MTGQIHHRSIPEPFALDGRHTSVHRRKTGCAERETSKPFLRLPMKRPFLWLLLRAVGLHAMWCETSARTGCRGKPRQLLREAPHLGAVQAFDHALSLSRKLGCGSGPRIDPMFRVLGLES